MEPIVLQLQQVGRLWHFTVDGSLMACGVTRSAVLKTGANGIRILIADQYKSRRLICVGFSADELRMDQTRQPDMEHPAGMSFEEAKQIFSEHGFKVCMAEVGTPVQIVDKLCIGYEWGWVIHWRPVDPKKGNDRAFDYHFPYLIDRVTGAIAPSKVSAGIRQAIVDLLQKRPPELCGPYPPGEQVGHRKIDAFEEAGAFTPIENAKLLPEELPSVSLAESVRIDRRQAGIPLFILLVAYLVWRLMMTLGRGRLRR